LNPANPATVLPRLSAVDPYETCVATPRERQRNALIVSMLADARLRPIRTAAAPEVI